MLLSVRMLGTCRGLCNLGVSYMIASARYSFSVTTPIASTLSTLRVFSTQPSRQAKLTALPVVYHEVRCRRQKFLRASVNTDLQFADKFGWSSIPLQMCASIVHRPTVLLNCHLDIDFPW
jgi:hypothetical protein